MSCFSCLLFKSFQPFNRFTPFKTFTKSVRVRLATDWISASGQLEQIVRRRGRESDWRQEHGSNIGSSSGTEWRAAVGRSQGQIYLGSEAFIEKHACGKK